MALGRVMFRNIPKILPEAMKKKKVQKIELPKFDSAAKNFNEVDLFQF